MFVCDESDGWLDGGGDFIWCQSPHLGADQEAQGDARLEILFRIWNIIPDDYRHQRASSVNQRPRWCWCWSDADSDVNSDADTDLNADAVSDLKYYSGRLSSPYGQ